MGNITRAGVLAEWYVVQGWVCSTGMAEWYVIQGCIILINLLVLRVSSMFVESESAGNSGHLTVSEILNVP